LPFSWRKLFALQQIRPDGKLTESVVFSSMYLVQKYIGCALMHPNIQTAHKHQPCRISCAMTDSYSVTKLSYTTLLCQNIVTSSQWWILNAKESDRSRRISLPENIYQTVRHTSRPHQPPETKHMGTQSMHSSLNTCCTSVSLLQDSDDPVVMDMLTAI